jgi:hypothetical protein
MHLSYPTISAVRGSFQEFGLSDRFQEILMLIRYA